MMPIHRFENRGGKIAASGSVGEYRRQEKFDPRKLIYEPPKYHVFSNSNRTAVIVSGDASRSMALMASPAAALRLWVKPFSFAA